MGYYAKRGENKIMRHTLMEDYLREKGGQSLVNESIPKNRRVGDIRISDILVLVLALTATVRWDKACPER